MDYSIIIMAKEPVPGKVKTRLSPSIPPSEATMLYEAMLLDTVDILLSLKVKGKFIFYAPPHSTYFERFARLPITILPQSEGDLGLKMRDAFHAVMESSGKPAIIIGTDIPLLTGATIENAARILESTDIVIGPCVDGGYYLLGMKEYSPSLFEGISWSTQTVLHDTLGAAEILGKGWALTDQLFDIDVAEDLGRLMDFLKGPRGYIFEGRRSVKEAKLITG